MQYLISDSFTDSLAKLTGDEQKAVKTTAFDLQMNPANSERLAARPETTWDSDMRHLFKQKEQVYSKALYWEKLCAAATLFRLNASKADADKALEGIRAVAAEQGVSQQASYFKEDDANNGLIL